MFKKLAFLLISQLFIIPAKAQDDIKNIEVSVNEPTPKELKYECYHLSITATENESSSATVNINVENTSEKYNLILFGHAYTEKDLKKQNIRFDKKSYGTASKEIIVCEGLGSDECLKIAPYGNNVLTFANISESVKEVELPIYIAKLKKKKLFSKEKYMIVLRARLILNIALKAEEKPDNAYEDIKRKYDELVAKIEANPVCPDKKHPVPEKEQTEQINREIDDLKDNIADVKSNNHWKERDEAYAPYKELLRKLDSIEIKKEVCDKCRRRNRPVTRHATGSRHSCKFCSTSPTDILRILQRTYQQLDNRKITKKAAENKIQAAHKAWTGGCSSLKSKMADESATRYKVERYYEAIVNY